MAQLDRCCPQLSELVLPDMPCNGTGARVSSRACRVCACAAVLVRPGCVPCPARHARTRHAHNAGPRAPPPPPPRGGAPPPPPPPRAPHPDPQGCAWRPPRRSWALDFTARTPPQLTRPLAAAASASAAASGAARRSVVLPPRLKRDTPATSRPCSTLSGHQAAADCGGCSTWSCRRRCCCARRCHTCRTSLACAAWWCMGCRHMSCQRAAGVGLPVCVRACVHACVRACVRVCVCVCVPSAWCVDGPALMLHRAIRPCMRAALWAPHPAAPAKRVLLQTQRARNAPCAPRWTCVHARAAGWGAGTR
jgi:hypothetical protein